MPESKTILGVSIGRSVIGLAAFRGTTIIAFQVLRMKHNRASDGLLARVRALTSAAVPDVVAIERGDEDSRTTELVEAISAIAKAAGAILTSAPAEAWTAAAARVARKALVEVFPSLRYFTAAGRPVGRPSPTRYWSWAFRALARAVVIAKTLAS